MPKKNYAIKILLFENKWLILQRPYHAESLNGQRMGGFIYLRRNCTLWF